MVGFVMEVFLDPNREFNNVEDPIFITPLNVSTAIKDSILANFAECVKYVNPITKLCIIRASREGYQKVWSAITMVRSIGNCLVMFNLLDLSAVKCDELKFEHYKLVAGACLTTDVSQQMKNCLEKIKALEH